MDFLLSNAWAQEAPAAQPPAFTELLPIIVIFVVFYFFLIRPQLKRNKEQKRMVESIAKGDEIVTSGGLLGKVKEVGDNFLVLEISENINIKVQRQSVTATMPKGTYEKTL